MKKIVIAFDIDGTLRKNTIEDTVVANERIRTLLVILSTFKNVEILVWSGGGELYARQVSKHLGIDAYVDSYADKEYIGCLKKECIAKGGMCNHHEFNTKIRPDIAIDDIHSFSLGDKNLICREK